MRITIPLGILMLSACGARVEPLGTRDFFVKNDQNAAYFLNALPKASGDEDCRARIEKLVCLVDSQLPPAKGEQPKPRECVQGVDLSPGVAALQAIYDAYTPTLKKVFCSLGHIYIERDFIGTAYAGADTDGSTPIMGIRESLLLRRPVPSLAFWVSWKEQLSFGGDPKKYEPRQDLVHVESAMSLAEPASDFLYYVIAHEFGHLLDFKYHANNFVCDSATPKAPCPAVAGSWSAISWTSMNPTDSEDPNDPWGLNMWIPNDSGRFEHREQLCFYGCKPGHGDPRLMLPLYTSLQKSSLLTAYSSTNAMDDFAEAVAFYTAIHNTQLEYTVVLPTGERFDLARKFRDDPVYALKRQWLDAFFAKVAGQN